MQGRAWSSAGGGQVEMRADAVLFTAVFLADKDGLEEADEEISYGLCGGHRVCAVI